MKTAEQWLEAWDRRDQTISKEDIEKHLSVLRLILLDGWRQGMSDAAEIAMLPTRTRSSAIDVARDITLARDAKTSL